MNIDPVGALKAGWPLVMRNPGALIGGMLISGIVQLVIQGVHIPILSPILGLVASAFFGGTYFVMALNVLDNKPAAIGDLFKPFPQLTNLIAANVIIGIAVMVGMLFLVIPGLILAVLLGFAPLLVLERNMAPMDALKASVDISKPIMGKLIVFGIVAFVLNFVGALLLGLGMLVTIPMTLMGWLTIYRQVAAPARTRRGTGPVQAEG